MFLSSSSVLRKGRLSLESIQTQYTFNFAGSDFVQDLYFKELELKVYHVPCLHRSSQLPPFLSSQ